MPALLSVLFKHGLELSAIAFVTLIVFYTAPRRPLPCNCAQCRRLAKRESHPAVPESTPGGSDTPLKAVPLVTPMLGDMDLDSVDGIYEASSADGKPDSTLSPSTSGSTASIATPRTQHHPRFPPIEVSMPRLSSPRIKTSPVISKEEFNLIMETSPHAKKFGHALAVRMVAERRRSMQASK